MKKISAYIIIGLLPFAQVQADNNEQRIQDSRAAIKSLAGELQNTLQASMKAKGPIESISVCRDEAPAIAGRVSEEKVLTVGRTSLKVRNQANKADAWEKKVLAQFEKRKLKGEELSKMDFYEITDDDGEKKFRYMKAIPTAEVCLKCHGDNIDQSLAAKIDELYPDDEATGFSLGDIRGAFTVTQSIIQQQ